MCIMYSEYLDCEQGIYNSCKPRQAFSMHDCLSFAAKGHELYSKPHCG